MLSNWCTCHVERQPAHPTTLWNQVRKVSRLSLYLFHEYWHICAQANTHRHTHIQTPAQTNPDAFSDTVSSSFLRLFATMRQSCSVLTCRPTRGFPAQTIFRARLVHLVFGFTPQPLLAMYSLYAPRTSTGSGVLWTALVVNISQ